MSKEQVEIWISVKYRWFCLGLNAVWKRCLSVQRNVRIQPRQLTFLDISRYNITRYRTQYEGKTSLRLGSHERCPYRPQRACYGCLSWDIRRKYTAIYRERSGGYGDRWTLNGFPAQRASTAENRPISWRHHEVESILYAVRYFPQKYHQRIFCTLFCIFMSFLAINIYLSNVRYHNKLYKILMRGEYRHKCVNKLVGVWENGRYDELVKNGTF